MNRRVNELNRTQLETAADGHPLAHFMLWSISIIHFTGPNLG